MKKSRSGLLFVTLPVLMLFFALTAGILEQADQPLKQPAYGEGDAEASPTGRYPSDWMERQRTFPYGTIKTDAYLEAIRQAAALHSAAGRSDYEWAFAGPLNIGGRITDIEVPGTSFSTIYVAAASGGILKTTNNGASWVNIFKDQPAIAIGDIAISSQDPLLMYAGTGEANSSSQSFRGDGMYKSVDGGTTWQHAGLEQSAYIGRIIIDHSNPDRVYAAACGNLFTPDENRGVYRSENGGATWERVLFLSDSTSAIDLVQHPDNPDILYAAMWERMRGLNYRRSFGITSGIWKTTDGGDTWTELVSGLPQGAQTGRIGLAISPSSPSTLYAFYDNQNEVAVYKTQNGGQSWMRTSDGNLQGINSSFGWYFGQIRVDPVSPDKVFVMGVYLYYSADGGNSWSETGYEMHVDHHAMCFHPVTGRIYEGNDGGLYFSDDTGFSWYKINNLPLTQFYDIETDRLNPQRIYGGTQDNNTIRTMTGQLSDWEAILGGDGFYSLVDYTNPSIIYAEYQWGALHKSTNGGSWMEPINGYWSSDRVNWSAPVVMHPQEPRTLYFGTYRVWKTTNGGNTWNAVSNDLTMGDDGSTFHTISTLAISSIEPDIVLAGTDDGRVHISTNGGSVWTDISAGLPERWITRVATDPFDVNTIYVTLSGFRWDEPLAHVYKSDDLGQNWQAIGNGLPELPVNVLVADPGEQGRLFIGTDAGVFMSEDAGETWQSMNQGIGNVPVTSMKIHPEENFLLIGTYGLSAYRFDLNQLNVGVEVNPVPLSSLTIAGAYPNPLSISSGKQLQITIGSSVSALARVSVADLNGRIIMKFMPVNLRQGLNSIQWNGCSDRGIPVRPGTYLLRVQSGSAEACSKVLVIE